MSRKHLSTKPIYFIAMFTLLTLVLYILDGFIGVIYEKVAPEFGRKNLALALNPENTLNEKNILVSRPHPYLTYENTPDYSKHGIRQHNNMGYRNKNNIKLLKDASTIRILVLGGSTTYGQEVNNPEDTWPAQMQILLNKSLSEFSTYKVEVINGGMPWASSAELLNHYIYRDRYLKPDIVILHTGGNDVGPLLLNNYNPEYTHWRSIKSGGANSLRIGEKRIIEASNIIKLLYAIWYSRIGYAISRAYIYTESSAKLNKEEALENVTHNMPTGFSRNISLLIRNIKLDGAIPVYFQFYRPGKEMFSEGGESALAKANRIVNFTELFEARNTGTEKTENAAKLICKNQNIEFIKIMPGDIPVEFLVDQCHLNSYGQGYKANLMSKRIFPYVRKLIDAQASN